MKKFIIVYYMWFIADRGYEYEQIEAADLDEAKKHAILHQYKLQKPTNHCGFAIIPIKETEEIDNEKTIWSCIKSKFVKKIGE